MKEVIAIKQGKPWLNQDEGLSPLAVDDSPLMKFV